MGHRPVVVIVLAAGEGTRMKSRSTPKVLHGFAGRSLLGHVLAATAALQPTHTAVIVGHRRDEVTAHLAEIAPAAQAVVQDQQHGTGHAVRVGLDALPATPDAVVLVVPGDAPLLRAETLQSLLDAHAASGAAATLLSSVVDDPTGYGRVIRAADGSVARVVEQRDADVGRAGRHRGRGRCVRLRRGTVLRAAVTRLSTANAQGEQYLPEVVVDLRRCRGGRSRRSSRRPPRPPASTTGCNWPPPTAPTTPGCSRRTCEPASPWSIPATTWVDADVTPRAST